MTQRFSRFSANSRIFLTLLAGSTPLISVGCSSDRCGGEDCFSSPDRSAEGGAGGAQGKKKVDDMVAEGGSALGGETGEAPEMEVEPRCVPKEVDAPDDDFIDSNCDGIDGDASRAVFVSLVGTVGGAGTMDEPAATIGEGIQLAQEKSFDVYVCKGTYPEELKITDNGVKIYGGYDCVQGWERGNHATVIAPPVGVPLTIQGASGVRVERLRFQASDATAPGGSSIGGIISDSIDVALHGVAISAGQGAAGADGTAGAVYTKPARAGAVATGTCASSYCMTGGIGGYTNPGDTCPDGSKMRWGGRGGNGASVSPYVAATNGANAQYTRGLGGLVSSTPSQRNGKTGYNRDPSANGTTSALQLGLFNDFVYQAINSGAAGTPGLRANGGGGGAGAAMIDNGGGTSFRAGDGGGQGGFGGCGGRAGTGGAGGGGSFSLLVASSEVTVTLSEFSSAQAGGGGAGGAGADGQNGGAGGPVVGKLSPGGAGGRGGKGGSGGDGAPGGGGPSIVIAVLSGDAPILEQTNLSPGEGGVGGKFPAGGFGKNGLSEEGYDFTSGTALRF